MSSDPRTWPWQVTVYHGPPCPPQRRCGAKQGEKLIEVGLKSPGLADVEWQVSTGRVDDPADHAGRAEWSGPDGYRTWPA